MREGLDTYWKENVLDFSVIDLKINQLALEAGLERVG